MPRRAARENLPETAPLGTVALVFAVTVAGWQCMLSPARAFPATDALNPSVIEPPTDAPPTPAEQQDLRHQIQAQGIFGDNVEPGWTFTPSLGIQEVFNDNLFQTQSNRVWDFSTIVTPGIAVLGSTPNIQVRLNYQPSVQYYARNTSQNSVTQELNTVDNFTLIPDNLFLDVRGLAGVLPTNGGFGGIALGQNTALSATELAALPKNQQSQLLNFGISPYFLHQFNDFGTLKVGYSYSWSSSSNTESFFPSFGSSASSGQVQSTINEEVVQFTSGQRFNRFNYVTGIDLQEYGGTGVLGGGYNYQYNNSLGYAVTDWLTVTGQLGYERILYSGAPGTRINGLTWQLGGTVEPNPDSSITASYGFENGANSVTFNGSYAVTARTRISASYNSSIGTQLQLIQNQFNQAGITTTGATVNSQTGAPLLIGNGQLSQQNALFRNDTFYLTLSTLLDRDTITVTVDYINQSVLSAGVGSTATSNHGTNGIVNWTHNFSDVLSSNAIVSYGTNAQNNVNGSGSNQRPTLAVVASLSYLLSETLTATARYAFINGYSGVSGQTMTQDVFIVGLTKQF
jgi:uncharacterized protein (PEP-CTERM system associated)